MLLLGVMFTAVGVELEADHQARVANIEGDLGSLVGSRVFALAEADLYDSNTPLNDLTDEKRLEGHRLKHFPRLRPLTIIAGQYFEGPDMLLLKLRLPDGSLAVCAAFLLRADGALIDELPYHGLWPTIPSILSRREIDAIQRGSVFVGMSEWALDAAMVVDGRSKFYRVSQVTSGPLTIYLDGTEDARVIRWDRRPSSRQPVHAPIKGGHTNSARPRRVMARLTMRS